MKHGFFVTGTDTGVGKTLAASALVHAYAQLGFAAAGIKPVASGCELRSDGLYSEDAAQLAAAANVVLPREVINPYAFEPPLAPHVAAALAGTSIALPVIQNAFKKAAAAADILIVEGVGGFRVPLNDTEDTAELARQLGLPVILVVGLRLGCLNHALLTQEAILKRGLRLVGWIANSVDPEMAAAEQNLQTLERMIEAPCLARVPFRAGADYEWAARHLSLEVLRNLVCA